MAFSYPLITWGQPEDVTTWLASGATVTASIADPFGGTNAYEITNNLGGGSLYRYKNITYQRDGYQDLSLFLKQGTAAATDIGFFDIVNSFNYRFRITWSATPSALAIGGTGASGSVYTPISVGNGWWLFRASTNQTVVSNGNRLLIYPATSSALSGSVQVYVQNAVLAGSPVYQSVADDQYSDDSVFNQSINGTEDAWTVRNDERLRGLLRWMPPRMTDNPYPYSGYYGYNESVGINVGFKNMIAAGRAKTLLRFSPDSSDIDRYIDGYMSEPMTDGITLEDNGSRSLTFGLRNPNGIPYLNY